MLVVEEKSEAICASVLEETKGVTLGGSWFLQLQLLLFLLHPLSFIPSKLTFYF